MRVSARLFTRYLEAGRPTGLTGLLTHHAPRAALLSIYGNTLDKLKTIPETSVYRQSVEALTKHRMSIVESIVPPQRTLEGKAGNQQSPEAAVFAEADLTADQITELEAKLGAGLIEEVIEVAKGELSLIDVIQKSQAWEPLEETPVPGQWRYFDRPTS